MIFQKIFQGVIIAVFLMIVAGIIIRIIPFHEYSFREQPYRVVNKQLKAGESLEVETDYCKLSNASGDITQTWDGPTRKIVFLGTFQGNKGCVKKVIAFTTPIDLTPGLYTLHGHGEYPKWLVGKAKVDTYTEEFEIIK